MADAILDFPIIAGSYYRPFSELTEDFTTLDTSKATLTARGAFSGGKLVVTATGDGLGWQAYKTTQRRDLTGGEVYLEVPQLQLASSGDAYTQLVVYRDSDGGDAFIIQVNSNTGSMALVRRLGGVDTYIAFPTYSSTTHRWWKIRESAGTVYFDASADGFTWTNLGSNATGFAVTGLLVEIGAEAASPSTAAQFDNLNLQFASATLALTGSGTLSLAGVPKPANTLGLSGSGSLSLTGAPKPAATLALSGTGTLSFASTIAASGSLALSGSGTLGLAGVAKPFGALALSGTGSLSLAGVPKPAGSLGLSGTGTLSLAAGTVTIPGSLALSGSGNLGEFVGYGELVYGEGVYGGYYQLRGTPHFVSSLALSGTGTLSVLRNFSGSLALSGTGTLGLVGVVAYPPRPPQRIVVTLRDLHVTVTIPESRVELGLPTPPRVAVTIPAPTVTVTPPTVQRVLV